MAFVATYQRKFQAMYGQVADNADYGNVVSDKQYQRLMSLLADAQSKGAKCSRLR